MSSGFDVRETTKNAVTFYVCAIIRFILWWECLHSPIIRIVLISQLCLSVCGEFNVTCLM